MTQIDIYTKLTLLPKALQEQVSDYIEFLLQKSQKETAAKRKPGLAKGMVKMSDDFDEPLNDFNEYM